ncbi:MAG TPA: type I-E CRISPR-associated protein Cas7/Cse4/CasC [Chitinispirillaceae bacterium]|nr:type I-E CRISPR-associated protein Cas7/Cse4/CasC [Chitinispirillaceae bacterium]
MSQFIQLHLLTNYAPANLNRDDLGRPKTAKMGGVDRLRISSQSLKRAWRTSDIFEETMKGNIGKRTKLFGVELYKYLVEKGVSDGKAKKWAQAMAQQFGKLKGTDKEKPLVDLEIEQLSHISPEEKDAAYKLCDTLISENRDPATDELNLLRKDIKAADIALFGRMLAKNPSYNVEAAAQVAHAITVNRVAVEDDYFTAVDDLNTREVDAGSAHIGESGFGSGVFYTYVCINKTLLEQNLGDTALANKAIRALTHAAATVSPSGKQNSYASRARALFILAEKGTQQPRQLSSAFLKPVDDAAMVNASVDRLQTLYKNMDKVYGDCADCRYSIDIEKAEGTFEELLNFVGA